VTDYEINRRLAEIAGVDVYDANGTGVTLKVRGWPLGPKWRPLTDWSQLGPLLVKTRLTLVQSVRGSDSARAYHPTKNVGVEAADTMRAVALAIIAAHEEE